MIHTTEEIINRLREHKGDLRQAKILAELNGCSLDYIKSIANNAGIEIKKLPLRMTTLSEDKAIERLISSGIAPRLVARRLGIHENKVVQRAKELGVKIGKSSEFIRSPDPSIMKSVRLDCHRNGRNPMYYRI